jgi:pimeloyl-ACP methyl ester carboxylesterase
MAIHRVSVASTALTCDISGHGKSVVFVHGNAETREVWRPQMEHCERRCRVVAPDLRGHGDSDKPAGAYPISGFVSDLAHLLDALDIDRAVIAGHSMGGRVAMSFALAHPERVRGLVLAGTSATPFNRAAEQIERVRALGIERELQEFIEFESSPDTPATMKHALLQEALKTPENVRIALWKAVSEFDVASRLDEILTPTLIIVGDLDRGTPVAAARLLHERIAGSQLVIVPDVAHFTMLERPDLVNRHIDAFLDRVLRD